MFIRCTGSTSRIWVHQDRVRGEELTAKRHVFLKSTGMCGMRWKQVCLPGGEVASRHLPQTSRTIRCVVELVRGFARCTWWVARVRIFRGMFSWEVMSKLTSKRVCAFETTTMSYCCHLYTVRICRDVFQLWMLGVRQSGAGERFSFPVTFGNCSMSK